LKGAHCQVPNTLEKLGNVLPSDNLEDINHRFEEAAMEDGDLETFVF